MACENRKIMVDDVIESKLGSYVDIITIYTVICRKATEIQSETFVFDTYLTYFGCYSLQDLKCWVNTRSKSREKTIKDYIDVVCQKKCDQNS